MIGLDLDGTVLNDEKTITPRTQSTLARACSAGVTVLPVTGRPLLGLPPELMDIPGVRYAVTSNGGAVWDVPARRLLAQSPVPKADVLWALDVIHRHGGVADVYVDGGAYTLESRFAQLMETAPANMRAYFEKTRTLVPAFAPWLEQEQRGVEKVTALFAHPKARQKAMETLRQSGRFEVTSSIPGNVELNGIGVDKGRALLALAAALGIAPEAVMVCGDSSNDLAMLRAAGWSVAMGNATPEALAAAHTRTATNNEDGVALAIEQYVLCP
jgi:Cof subfamily protein (haloacid dehalogenase superfamily)